MAQDVEPFDYQKTNNMDEHKQIVNKVNEIVDVINDANLDGIPKLQSDVSTLKSDVANLGSDVGQNTSDIAGLDGDVDNLTTNVSDIKDDITGLKAKDSEMANDITTNENAITTLNGKVIKSVSATVPAEGKLRTTITLEDNSVFATDDTILGLIATGGVQIISTATARAFKLRFTLTDGTFWDTNDFVIPEGGGTDVTVTSVSIVAGSTDDTFKISIGLSDGDPIESNDYPFPTIPVASTATAGIVKVGNGLTISGDGTLSAVPSGVPVATANTAGIVKIGANINVTADGTISVTFPDAPDLTPYLTKAEASTTYVTSTVANSTYATKTNLSELTGEMMNSPRNVIGMASPSTSGLMSDSDKTKLDGIANGANNYVLPIGGFAIGGVKNGGNVIIKSDGTMNTDNEGDIWEEVTISTIGNIKQGDIIKLCFKILNISGLPTSWETEIENLNISTSENISGQFAYEFIVDNTTAGNAADFTVINILQYPSAMVAISFVLDPDRINNGSSWGSLRILGFNGKGSYMRGISLFDSYIFKAYIKRS